MCEIVIRFNTNNVFNPDNKTVTEEDTIVNSLWVVNCAMSAIERSYKEGTYRNDEMHFICADLLRQIKDQITPELYEKYRNRFFDMADAATDI